MTTATHLPIAGLIVPPLAGEVPPESIMYPEIKFIAEGLGLQSVDPQGYDQVIDSVVAKAKKLAEQGAQAISLMGTSLSFYRGHQTNAELIHAMQAATGVPCTTMSQAVIHALAALNAKNIAVATSYVEVVNQRLLDFLHAEGYTAVSCVGLGESGVEAMAQINTTQLVELCISAYDQASTQPEAILLSCGGLRTLDTILEVERRLGVPVVASSPAGFWDIARLVCAVPAKPQFGQLAAKANDQEIG